MVRVSARPVLGEGGRRFDIGLKVDDEAWRRV